MVDTIQIKIKKEDRERLSKRKVTEYEPIHHTVSVLLDKLELFENNLKKGRE